MIAVNMKSPATSASAFSLPLHPNSNFSSTLIYRLNNKGQPDFQKINTGIKANKKKKLFKQLKTASNEILTLNVESIENDKGKTPIKII